MRIDEDKIWNAYTASFLVEKKKGLPPWLKKKDGKEDEGDEKEDKKSDKKSDKKKKNLPPWLKGKKKGKKTIKEGVGGMTDREVLESVLDKMAQASGDVTLTMEEAGVVHQYLSDGVNDELFHFPDEEEGGEPSDMTDVEADADTLKSAGMGTDEDYGGADERI